MKHTRKVCIKNKMGLHTRPATAIVRMLQGTKCDVLFTYKRETVNARSILSILTLAVRSNARLTITTEGSDAELTMTKLVEAFEDNFGE